MTLPRCCSISVDLDPLRCYYEIHGIVPTSIDVNRGIILRRCLPRFLDVFSRYGIRATFFVVADQLDSDVVGVRASENRELIRRCIAEGHEIANHSYSHPYRLARMGRREIDEELDRARAILSGCGAEVVGFRSPGYDLSPAILAHLCSRGYRYDSSVFPAPAYYLAKLVVLSALQLRGTSSASVLTEPRSLVAPAQPYRPDSRAPWRRGESQVIELPVAVTPRLRLPLIGTSLIVSPQWLLKPMLEAAMRLPFFNFELHGIDLADADSDSIGAELVARQPDLRHPLATKLERVEAILTGLGERLEFLPLAEAALRFG